MVIAGDQMENASRARKPEHKRPLKHEKNGGSSDRRLILCFCFAAQFIRGSYVFLRQ